jgi:polysaccharide export outer membrane protein
MSPRAARRAPARRTGRAALAFIAALAALTAFGGAGLAGAAAAAEAYRLQPGDRLRVSVAGLRDADVEVQIDLDGMLSLPQAGRIVAAGRTLAEFEAELRGRAAGQAIKRYAPDGTPLFIPLAPEDIAVAVTAYRPVYVTGDVQRPGLVEFRPGMTARAAIAVAGGASRVAALGVDPMAVAMQAPRLQADYRTLSFTHAGLVARLWGIDAALADDAAAAPPTATVSVPPEVFAALLDEQRRRAAADIDQLAQERVFLTRAIEESDRRIDTLNRQVSAQRETVATDEAEFESARASLARGVIQLSRVQDIRRNLNLSASRLLDTENNLSRVMIERSNFQRQLASLEATRETRLMAERETVSQRLLETAPRLTAAREQLELNGILPAAPGVADAGDPLLTVRRNLGGVTAPMAVGLDDEMTPGDVLTVALPLIDEMAGATAPIR